MISTNGFSLAQPDDIGDGLDSHDSGPHDLASELIGPSGVFEPTFDLDGDGRDETATIFGTGFMSVVSDTDGDGQVDRIIEFGHTARYQSWDLIRLANGSADWISGDSGAVGS